MEPIRLKQKKQKKMHIVNRTDFVCLVLFINCCEMSSQWLPVGAYPCRFWNRRTELSLDVSHSQWMLMEPSQAFGALLHISITNKKKIFFFKCVHVCVFSISRKQKHIPSW